MSLNVRSELSIPTYLQKLQGFPRIIAPHAVIRIQNQTLILSPRDPWADSCDQVRCRRMGWEVFPSNESIVRCWLDGRQHGDSDTNALLTGIINRDRGAVHISCRTQVVQTLNAPNLIDWASIGRREHGLQAIWITSCRVFDVWSYRLPRGAAW